MHYVSIENANDNYEENIPTFNENEETWENEVLYSPFETEDDEDEDEDVLVVEGLSVSIDPVITSSMIKNQWYVLKGYIRGKNCQHMLKLVEQMDEAIFLDNQSGKKQLSIEDYFQKRKEDDDTETMSPTVSLSSKQGELST